MIQLYLAIPLCPLHWSIQESFSTDLAARDLQGGTCIYSLRNISRAYTLIPPSPVGMKSGFLMQN